MAGFRDRKQAPLLAFSPVAQARGAALPSDFRTALDFRRAGSLRSRPPACAGTSVAGISLGRSSLALPRRNAARKRFGIGAVPLAFHEGAVNGIAGDEARNLGGNRFR